MSKLNSLPLVSNEAVTNLSYLDISVVFVLLPIIIDFCLCRNETNHSCIGWNNCYLSKSTHHSLKSPNLISFFLRNDKLVFLFSSVQGGSFFVAGNAKQMPDQVKDALKSALVQHSGDKMTEEAAKKLVGSMESDGRYQTETWSWEKIEKVKKKFVGSMEIIHIFFFCLRRIPGKKEKKKLVADDLMIGQFDWGKRNNGNVVMQPVIKKLIETIIQFWY